MDVQYVIYILLYTGRKTTHKVSQVPEGSALIPHPTANSI